MLQAFGDLPEGLHIAMGEAGDSAAAAELVSQACPALRRKSSCCVSHTCYRQCYRCKRCGV